jgi:hypothetical protein
MPIGNKMHHITLIKPYVDQFTNETANQYDTGFGDTDQSVKYINYCNKGTLLWQN